MDDDAKDSDVANPKKEKPKRRRRMMDDEDAAQDKEEAKKAQPQQGWGSPTKQSAPDRDADDKEESSNKPEVSAAGKRRGIRDAEDEETEMIMIIPDLDEEDEQEDITTQVAVAPKNLARRVQSLAQLDREIKYQVPAAGGLDLSILTKCLVPPKMVEEEDVTWHFDTLLQEVTQEFHAEQERRAEDAAEAAKMDPDTTVAATDLASNRRARKANKTEAEPDGMNFANDDDDDGEAK